MEIKPVAGDRINSYNCQGATKKSQISADEIKNMDAEIWSC